MQYERLLRPMLFRMDPEQAHHLALKAITMGLVKGKLLKDKRLETDCMGRTFPNPLGLAAGVDKSGEAVHRWGDMGFGFAEVGTITFHEQPGNPKPRLFRYPSRKAIVNRMGFNNAGAVRVAEALRNHPSKIPLGINLGKSKVTALEDAPADYRSSFQLLEEFGDYFVVNVSSPNTPGLRDLQSVEALTAIRDAIGPTSKPMLVKIAPDLHTEDILAIVNQVNGGLFDGVIATNTTISRQGVPEAEAQSGGLSGLPLKARSNEVIAQIDEALNPGKVLIGVGGVFQGRDIVEKIERGADLVQVYTGWVYGGPLMPYRALAEMLVWMEAQGIANLSAIPRRSYQ